ncbi:uncharacterized, partial [Tachysurus ichikawai]
VHPFFAPGEKDNGVLLYGQAQWLCPPRASSPQQKRGQSIPTPFHRPASY